MAGKRFEASGPLRFAECDPAGIAFYPKLVERVSNCVEDWFAGPLGLSFDAMHRRWHAVVPTRALAMEFLSPGRLGEPVTLSLTVEQLGRASISLRITATLPEGRVMFEARQTLVWCRLSEGGPHAEAIPDDIASKMRDFLEH